MTTFEELESRVRLLEAAGRGEVIALRQELEVFRHETRNRFNGLDLAVGNHSSKLSDLNGKVDMLTDMVAEIRRLLLPKAGSE